MGRGKFILVVSLVSLIKCLLFYFLIEILATPGVRIGHFPDSYMYETIAENIAAGHGFSLSVNAPFLPTMFKEPLYPVIIFLVKLISVNSFNAIVAFQMLLNPLIAVFIYFIGRQIFGENIARLSSLLVALIPVYGEISFLVMPEFVFVLFLCASFFSLIKAVYNGSLLWYAASGLLFGLCALCRNASLPLVLLYPAAVLFLKRKCFSAALFLKLFIFAAAFCAVTLPWMHRNQQKLSFFSISRRGGEILSHQAYWAANFTPEERKAYALYIISGSLAQKFYPKVIGDDMGAFEYYKLMRIPYVDSLLTKNKEGEVDRILFNEAIRDITGHPIKFAAMTAIIGLQSFKYFESIALMMIKGEGGLSWAFSGARLFLFLAGFSYSLIAFAGMFRAKKTEGVFLILATIIYFYLVLTLLGIVPGALQRNIQPLTVFYSYFVVLFFAKKNAHITS